MIVIYNSKNQVAGIHSNGEITPVPSQEGEALAELLHKGVPGLRGVFQGDVITETWVTVPPEDPLFSLALYEWLEREGWKTVSTPDSSLEPIDFVVNNCGIGKGGFQAGNNCASKAGSALQIDREGVSVEHNTDKINSVLMRHYTTDEAVKSIEENGFEYSVNSMYGKGVYFTNSSQVLPGSKKYQTPIDVRLKKHNQLVVENDTDVPRIVEELTGKSFWNSEVTREALLDRGVGSIRFPMDNEMYTLVLDKNLIEITPNVTANRLEDITFVANNCGTGKGGFQPGNSCATGGSGKDVGDVLLKLIPIKGLTNKDPVKFSVHPGTLGGSTGAMLAHKGDFPYVLKPGKTEGHAKNEYHANLLYKAAGVNIPHGVLYKDENGKEYLANIMFIGTSLGGVNAEVRAKAIAKLQKDFAMDAILANWDVIGADMDNVMVAGDGELIKRIDNGGALSYRAQGGPKGSLWNGEATELETMRKSDKNPSTKAVFGPMTDQQVSDSIDKALAKRDEVLVHAKKHLNKEDYDILVQRFDSAEKYKETLQTSGLIWKDEPDYSSSGKGSGKTGDQFVKELTSKSMELSSGKVFKDKMAFLNPQGIVGGTVLIPMVGSTPKDPQNTKNFEELKKILPAGTEIKGVWLAPNKEEGGLPWVASTKSNQAKIDALYKGNAAVSGKTPFQVAKEVQSGVKASSVATPEKAKKGPHPLDDDTIKTVKHGAQPSPSSPEEGTWVMLYGEKVKEPSSEEYKNFEKKLSKEEYNQISSWKNGYSTTFRIAIDNNQLNESHVHLLNALDKAPDISGSLYRGVHSEFAQKQMDQVLERGVGGIWSEYSPTGASRNVGTAHSFSHGKLLFKYNVTKAAAIDKMAGYSGEQEVIVRPQSLFKIKRIIRNGRSGDKFIEMIVELDQVR